MNKIILAAVSAAAIVSVGVLTSTHAKAVTGARGGIALAAQTASPVEDVRLPRGFSHGGKAGFRGRHTPPGWAHGRKMGWGSTRTMPPGLRR